MDEPTLSMLATAGGLAGVVFIITNLIRPLVPAGAFDRWGAVVAVAVGIALAVVYVVIVGPVTPESLLQAALVGLFGGSLSQNVNTAVRRATTPPA
jgi:hypothetical protein